MPIYEYKCESCEKVFSELSRMADRDKPLICPDCGGKAEVIFSAFAQRKSSSPSCPQVPGGGCGSGFS